MTEFIQLSINGVSLGAIYGLVALGFVLIIKATGVFTFAHGELVAVGAYALFLLDGPMWVRALVALAATTLVGLTVERLVIRPLRYAPLFASVMATFGVALVLKTVLIVTAGTRERVVRSPVAHELYRVGPFRISLLDILIIASAAVAVAIFSVFFTRTRTGLMMRAMSSNVETAALVGVSTKRVTAATWVIAALLAGLGGVFLANIAGVVGPSMAGIGLRAFPAAVVGGIRSLHGAVVGGILIGLTELWAARYIGSDARSVAPYIVLMIVLIVRPNGLFGAREVSRA